MLVLTMTSLAIAAPVMGLDAPSHASVRVSWRLSMVKEMGTMSQCGLLRLSSMMGILRCGLWWCDGSRNLIRNYLTSSIGCWLPVVVLTIFWECRSSASNCSQGTRDSSSYVCRCGQDRAQSALSVCKSQTRSKVSV
jgi:hypothetical protein